MLTATDQQPQKRKGWYYPPSYRLNVNVMLSKISSHAVGLSVHSSLKEWWQVLSSSWDGRPFGHNRHGPKIGDCASFWGELDPHVMQCGMGRSVPSYQVASWSIQPFAHNRHGPKIGGGAGSPSSTMWPGPRPSSTLPSGILIPPAIWPQ